VSVGEGEVFGKIAIEVVNSRQWLLGVRYAALEIHDEVAESFEPAFESRILTSSEWKKYSQIARDMIRRNSTPMFMLLSNIPGSHDNGDGIDLDFAIPVQLDHPDEIQELIAQYVESIQFVKFIAYPVSPPGRHCGYDSHDSYVAQSNAKRRFDLSKCVLKRLIADIDSRLGIRNIDHRLKPVAKPKQLVYGGRMRVIR
jgi:hypothetical protein